MKHNQFVIFVGMIGLVAVLTLAGCDRAARSTPSANPHRARVMDDGGLSLDQGAGGRRDVQTPLYQGEPLWAENKHGNAQENAAYQFRLRGADVGAKSLDDYLQKVHAFFRQPSKDAEQMVRASNGDRLIYDRRRNLFGVMRKDGAPRVLMRPPGGAAYWREQKQRAGLTRAPFMSAGTGAPAE